MADFKIMTDNTADLPEEYKKKYDIGCLFLPYTMEGITYTGKNRMETKAFYDRMRAGILSVTSQVNPEEAKEAWRSMSGECQEILYLAFSSGLSGTYNSCRLAAMELMEECPQLTIRVVDSLCASLGEGLFVQKAVELRSAGKSMQETADWLEAHKLNFVHVFTVDDLNHLYRGGRVSRAAAILGTVAGIKPILHVDEAGHLVPVFKVRGRKKALLSLVDYMEQHMGRFREKNDVIFISHGDCPEDAEFVRDEVKRRYGVKRFLIHPVGPTIGAHSGPGTVALFFMGEER